MAVDITYLGHSGFLIRDTNQPEYAVAIDPFLTGNDSAKHTPDDIKCSHIVISHGHADHFGDDTFAIAKKNSAPVFGVFELAEFCTTQGVEAVEPMNPGGQVQTPFGFVALTDAVHSSSYQGQYMGVATGIILNIGGVTIYHAGDTALFRGMKTIRKLYKPNVAMLPIGDRFTMGPDHAARAAEMISPKFVIPMHYNTWPIIEQDPATFHPPAISTQIMAAGDTWHYGG